MFHCWVNWDPGPKDARVWAISGSTWNNELSPLLCFRKGLPWKACRWLGPSLHTPSSRLAPRLGRKEPQLCLPCWRWRLVRSKCLVKETSPHPVGYKGFQCLLHLRCMYVIKKIFQGWRDISPLRAVPVVAPDCLYLQFQGFQLPLVASVDTTYTWSTDLQTNRHIHLIKLNLFFKKTFTWQEGEAHTCHITK